MYTIREFRGNLSKILDESRGKCVHIGRGEEVFELRLCTPSKELGDVVCTPIKTKEDAKKKVATLSERVGYNPLKYGCGCVKVDGENLCKKHLRV